MTYIKLISCGPLLYCNTSLLHMIINIDNIAGNEKAFAGKQNVKVTYTQDLSWIVIFLS